MKAQLNSTNIKSFIKTAKVNAQLNDTGINGITGLHLKIFKSGCSFRVTYRIKGARRTYKIGNYPTLTATQARDKAKKILGRVADGEDPQETKTNEIIEQSNTGINYLETVYSIILKKQKSGAQTEQMIRNHFSKLLKKPMESLNKADVRRWETEQQLSDLKFTTYKRSYGAFQTMLNDADDRDYLSSNPIKGVSLKKINETAEEISDRKQKRTYLTKKQMISLLQVLDTYQEQKRDQRRSSRLHGKPHLPDFDAVEYVDHVKPIISLLFYTGFRSGDAIGLRWDDVNFNFSIISKVIEKTAHKILEPKTFPIAAPLVTILKKWHAQQGKPKTGLVFPSPVTGKRFDKRALQRPWIKIRKLAKLPEELQLYTLRHNFASHLIMNGSNLLSVAKLMGHSDIQMIIDHYGHLQPSLLKEQVEIFASMVDDTEQYESQVKE